MLRLPISSVEKSVGAAKPAVAAPLVTQFAAPGAAAQAAFAAAICARQSAESSGFSAKIVNGTPKKMPLGAMTALVRLSWKPSSEYRRTCGWISKLRNAFAPYWVDGRRK